MKHEVALKLRRACLAAGFPFLLHIAEADPLEPSLFVDVKGASVTVIANDVSVQQVLEQLALQSGIIVYSRAALDAPVTISARESSIPDVVRRILRHRNFTLHYVSDAATGLPLFGSRLWIFATDATSKTALWSVGQLPGEWTLKYSAGDPEKNRLRAISNVVTWENDSDIDPDLLVAMNDPAVAVRKEAVRVLGEVSAPESLRHLKNALHDPERKVRAAAIAALTEYGNDDVVLALATLLHDQNPEIRAEVIDAMAHIDSKMAQYYLRQALSDAAEVNRETAAGYLAEIATAKTANRF